MSGAPDFAEPVIGYRAWHVGDDGVLRPWTFSAQAWEPGINHARCARNHRHRPPVADCMCGLYALSDPSDRRLHLRGDQAVGAIAAWGALEVHRTGFRAETACVVALALPAGADDEQRARLAQAAARHRVALVAPAALSAEARRHGAPLDPELLPPAWPATPAPGAPPAVAPADFAGPARGIALDAHLWVETALGAVVVGATRQLVARASAGAGWPLDGHGAASPLDRPGAGPGWPPDGHGAGPASPLDPPGAGAAPVLPEPGAVLAAGDRLGTFGDCGLFAPVGGRVLAVNPRLAAEPDVLARDPEGAGWLLRLAPVAWQQEARAITWGRAAARHYAACLARDAARGDPLADVRVSRLRALPPARDGAEVLARLRAERARPRFPDAETVAVELGGRLRDALAGDPELRARLGRLGAVVAFVLRRPTTALLLDLRGDARVVVAPSAPDPDVERGDGLAGRDAGAGRGLDADVVLSCTADDAYRWFTGTLDPATALRTGDLRCPAGPAPALRTLAVLKHLRVAGWTTAPSWASA